MNEEGTPPPGGRAGPPPSGETGSAAFSARVAARVDALTDRLASRRGIVALWVVSTLALTLVASLMHVARLPGWDDAAHLYKLYLLEHGHSILWDDFWYGGSYGSITYGFLFYLLAAVVPAKAVVVVAGGLVPPLFLLYQRGMWGIRDPWPAWLLALVMAAYLAHGQDPFVLALALTLGGLALLARDRPLWAAAPVAAGIFANPMGLVVCGVFVLADVLARPELRRRYFVFLAALAPFLLGRALLGWAFSEPGGYLNETSQLLLYLGFALAGAGLAGLNAVHARRPFVILFFTYAALCVVSFVLPGSPLGNNIGRFLFVFGAPLLFLLRHSRLRRPFPGGDLAILVVVAFAVIQFSAPYSHFTKVEERPQTRASYFAPALAAARELQDPDYRFHVVALRRHWEAYFFPRAGHAITRGWYRQADAIHNAVFYTTYDAAEYVAWLKSMGVEYVFLPDGLLDAWSRREARILRTSPEFQMERETGAWTVYRLSDAQPIAVGLDGGTAQIGTMGHQDVDLVVDRPGRYLIKLTWSPYWDLERGSGTLRRGPGNAILLDAGETGAYSLRFSVAPGEVVSQLGARLGL